MSQHIIVHLYDGGTKEITQHPAELLEGEELADAAVRVQDEQQELAGKHYMVENVVEAPKHGRHKEGNS